MDRSATDVFFDELPAPAVASPTLLRNRRAAALAAAMQADGMTEQERIAAALANPLSYLWLLFSQNDTISYQGTTVDALGEDQLMQNTTLFMPVISMQLTESWKTIFRPVIPINSFRTVENVNLSVNNPGQVTGVDLERASGIGDIVLWTAFSNSYAPPFVWGFGPTLMFDTSTDPRLGTGHSSAGPMGLAVGITEKWIFGAVAQHWWSYTASATLPITTNLGIVDVTRPDVNLTDIQVILRRRLSPATNIGMAPNWRYNWNTEQWDIPLGGGFDTLVNLGMPVKIGVEAYYFVSKSDALGPNWQLRFLFVPVIPAPGWAGVPRF